MEGVPAPNYIIARPEQRDELNFGMRTTPNALISPVAAETENFLAR